MYKKIKLFKIIKINNPAAIVFIFTASIKFPLVAKRKLLVEPHMKQFVSLYLTLMHTGVFLSIMPDGIKDAIAMVINPSME